jgi:hypothetical protein
MANENDRDRAEPTADVVQDAAEIAYRQSLLAVPAPQLEARPEDDGSASPQRVLDGPRDREHAQHGRLEGRRALGAD